MKLTLSAGGGVTGLNKKTIIDTDTLDESTKEALMNYMKKIETRESALNYNECWVLNDKEVPIDTGKMDDNLKKLYEQMKKDLSYTKK